MHAYLDILMILGSLLAYTVQWWTHKRATRKLKAAYEASLAEWKQEVRLLVQQNADLKEVNEACQARATKVDTFNRQLEERLNRIGQAQGRINILAVAEEMGLRVPSGLRRDCRRRVPLGSSTGVDYTKIH